MNRIEFFQSIKLNDLAVADYIVNCFNQVMLLYNILSKVSNNIEISRMQDNMIQFRLEYENPNNIQELNNHISQIPYINVYGMQYSLQSHIDTPNSIIIIMIG